MRKRKLLDRLINNPRGATFQEVRTVLFHHGFQLERVTGSHHIFSRPDATFAIPVHGNRVKFRYVRQVIELLQQSEGDPE
jgi:predicted RNA binding protein YcfA (HicA-like mRNA interferase family)